MPTRTTTTSKMLILSLLREDTAVGFSSIFAADVTASNLDVVGRFESCLWAMFRLLSDGFFLTWLGTWSAVWIYLNCLAVSAQIKTLLWSIHRKRRNCCSKARMTWAQSVSQEKILACCSVCHMLTSMVAHAHSPSSHRIIVCRSLLSRRCGQHRSPIHREAAFPRSS